MRPLPMMLWTLLFRVPWPLPSPDIETSSPGLLLVTSGDHNWRPVQTCSLVLIVQPHSTDIWWSPKHIWLASGWYASYWNAFLLLSKKLHGIFELKK